MHAVLKECTLAVVEGGGRRQSGASSGIGSAESVREKCCSFALVVSSLESSCTNEQQRLLGLDGAWLCFLLKNRGDSHLEVSSKFQGALRNVTSLDSWPLATNELTVLSLLSLQRTAI